MEKAVAQVDLRINFFQGSVCEVCFSVINFSVGHVVRIVSKCEQWINSRSTSVALKRYGQVQLVRLLALYCVSEPYPNSYLKKG